MSRVTKQRLPWGSFVGRRVTRAWGGLLDDNREVEGTKCGCGVGTRQRVESLLVGTLLEAAETCRLFVSFVLLVPESASNLITSTALIESRMAE